MTSLGLVGIADKGTYSAEATYNKGQFVLHDGSTWLALKDNLNGVTPAEGENWKYLARGFAAELLSLVTAIDSQGLSGSQGGRVNAQSLIDVLADKVANQLIAKSMMSNVQVNDAEKVPTSALAYAMQQSIETLNSNLDLLITQKITVPISFNVPDYSKYRFLYFKIITDDSYSGDAFIVPRKLYNLFSKSVRIDATLSGPYYVHLSMLFATGTLRVERANFGTAWNNVTIQCYGIK